MASHATRPGFGRPGMALAALALSSAAPAPAAVGINHLADMPFGSIANLTADVSQSESVCAYAGALGGNYSVTGSGSGSGGAFTLAGPGSATLAYEVQWAATAGQTAGTRLTAGTALTGQNAIALDCTLGLASDASLIVILRAGALSAATAGSYSGTLSILLAPN